jgi:N-acetylglucosamine kinase-like BadF-type ATPase
MTAPLLLGIDGGGTSTVAWLADRNGHPLGQGRSGPSNIKSVGPERVAQNLDQAIGEAFLNASISISEIAVSCLGLAGFDREEDKNWLRNWAVGHPWSRQLVLVNDGDLVVAAGSPEGYGIGLIAGTGSIAVGLDQHGRKARAGGWGYLFGDEGSGFAIAVAALKRVARTLDGRAIGQSCPDILTSHICQALDISEPSGLVTAIYANGFDRARIAALAPSVLAAASKDPSIIDDIIIPAGRELGETVAAVARKLEWVGGPLHLAMAGSFLLSSAELQQSVIHDLTTRGYQVMAREVANPVEGAIAIARRALYS